MNKLCRKCGTMKSIDSFYKDKKKSDGHQTVCIHCVKIRQSVYFKDPTHSDRREYFKEYYKKGASKYYIAKAARRRANKLKATPKWANVDKILEIYKNCPKGYHVDHIIPPKGENVSGLHVEYNLQYLPAIENLRKSNKVIEINNEC